MNMNFLSKKIEQRSYIGPPYSTNQFQRKHHFVCFNWKFERYSRVFVVSNYKRVFFPFYMAWVRWSPWLNDEQEQTKGRKTIERVGWRRHSSLVFLILLFTKPNIEASGWLYHTKNTHHSPFSRVTPPNYIALSPRLRLSFVLAENGEHLLFEQNHGTSLKSSKSLFHGTISYLDHLCFLI